MKLKQIHDDLFNAKLKLAQQHLQNNSSNAGLIAISQGAIGTGACALVLVAPTP